MDVTMMTASAAARVQQQQQQQRGVSVRSPKTKQNE